MSNILPMCFSAMPAPLSSTISSNSAPSRFTDTRIRPPCGVNLSALEMRLYSIFSTLSRSSQAGISGSWEVSVSLTPRWRA